MYMHSIRFESYKEFNTTYKTNLVACEYIHQTTHAEMKCCLIVIVIAWLQLGSALPSINEQITDIEERLAKLEAIVDMKETAVEGMDADILDVNTQKIDTARNEDSRLMANLEDTSDASLQAVVVTGCGDATEHLTTYLTNVANEYKTHFTGAGVTCGKCSTLEFQGDWGAKLTICPTNSGNNICMYSWARFIPFLK